MQKEKVPRMVRSIGLTWLVCEIQGLNKVVSDVPLAPTCRLLAVAR